MDRLDKIRQGPREREDEFHELFVEEHAHTGYPWTTDVLVFRSIDKLDERLLPTMNRYREKNPGESLQEVLYQAVAEGDSLRAIYKQPRPDTRTRKPSGVANVIDAFRPNRWGSPRHRRAYGPTRGRCQTRFGADV